MLGLSHLAFTVCSFITYEIFFIYQLTHYLNGYIESTHELAKKANKFKLEIEMLKRAKEKVEKKVGEVSMKVNTIERRAEDIEAVLRNAVEKNSRLLDKTTEFEAQVKRNTTASEENTCLQKEIK